eukprot:3288158-Prorocentrum_lima.AAC.1
MTSSLVGSEMCIRDRRKVDHRRAGLCGHRRVAIDPGMLVVEVESAVSYTHLTLPTICSV